MFEKIDEQIQVLVNFSKNGPIPLLFKWNGNSYKITQVNFTHISHQGKSQLVHYAVSTAKEAFNLTFDTNSLNWQLNEVFFEGFGSNQNLKNLKYAKSNISH